MNRRPARIAAAVAVAAMLALPGATLAAPPADVVAWQDHLDHMQAMGPNLGAHIGDCIAMHGSMAGQLGPDGTMAQDMGGMMGTGR